jgi:hypothetical protein
MRSSGSGGKRAAPRERGKGFAPGTLVVVSLDHPHEKFWGVLLEVAAAGVSVCGIELSSFDDFLALLRAHEAAGGCEVFFPMHRVQRVEIDVQNGGIPSLGERFRAATGRSPEDFLGTNRHRSVRKR